MTPGSFLAATSKTGEQWSSYLLTTMATAWSVPTIAGGKGQDVGKSTSRITEMTRAVLGRRSGFCGNRPLCVRWKTRRSDLPHERAPVEVSAD